ncbi:MAG: GNAT family N-acetyltransferase [Solirubrobacterales bacterium]
MESGAGSPQVVASEVAAERAAEVFAEAFNRDPVWGWAFPDEDRRFQQHTVFWRFFIDAAAAHGWVWLSAGGGAATLWVPPGCPEVSAGDEERIEPMLTDLVGAAQTEVLLETFERFDAAHPPDPPHYYLSLLGTHSDHRGRGVGMRLLADNLGAIDEEGMPAYLESTNPEANNHRYERLGFRQVGEFDLPGDGPPVATMWREARA